MDSRSGWERLGLGLLILLAIVVVVLNAGCSYNGQQPFSQPAAPAAKATGPAQTVTITINTGQPDAPKAGNQVHYDPDPYPYHPPDLDDIDK